MGDDIIWTDHAKDSLRERPEIDKRLVEDAVRGPDDDFEAGEDYTAGRRVAHEMIEIDGNTIPALRILRPLGRRNGNRQLLPHIADPEGLEGCTVDVKVKLKYAPHVNAARISLRPGKSARTEEIAPGVLVDFTDDGMPLSIDLLNVQRAFGGIPTGIEFEVAGLVPAKG